MGEHSTESPWSLPYPSSTGSVKLGAKDFAELAERLAEIFKKKIGGLATINVHSGAYGAEDGEWGLQETNATTTLPAVATQNQLIALTAGGSNCKIQASGGADIQVGAVLASTISVYEGQSVLLQSDGSNWHVIAEAGAVSPASMEAISGQTEITSTTHLTNLSTTRPVELFFYVEIAGGATGRVQFYVHGAQVGNFQGAGVNGSWCGIIAPGESVEWEFIAPLSTSIVHYRTRTL